MRSFLQNGGYSIPAGCLVLPETMNAEYVQSFKNTPKNEYESLGLQVKPNNQYILNEEKRIRILIAESDNDLLLLFDDYLSSLDMITETASSGGKALLCFLDGKQRKSPYDVIILDAHLFNPSGLDIAKRIHSEEPEQKLVLLTTTPKEYLSAECLKIAGIRGKDILTMPFKLSKLAKILETN